MTMISDELKTRIEECNKEIQIMGKELDEIETYYKDRRERFDRFVGLRTILVSAWELENKEGEHDEGKDKNTTA